MRTGASYESTDGFVAKCTVNGESFEGPPPQREPHTFVTQQLLVLLLAQIGEQHGE